MTNAVLPPPPYTAHDPGLRPRATRSVYVLLALPAVFWLANRLPFLQISAIVFGIGLLAAVTLRRFRLNAGSAGAVLFVITTGAYFFFSYLLSGQSLSEFFSYEFLRRDGNFFFAYTPFFVFSVAAAQPRKMARMLFRFALGSAVVIGVAGIIEYALGRDILMTRMSPGGFRMFSALNQAHNAAGSLYAIALLLGLSLYLFRKSGTVRLAFLVAVLFVCLTITMSRGALIAAIPGGMYLLHLRYRGWEALKRMLLLGFLAFPPFYLAGGVRRMVTITDLDHVNTVTRIEHWRMAWELFRMSPLIGVGFGRYNDYGSSSVHLRFVGVPGIAAVGRADGAVHSDSHAHNSYFHLLAETGIIGLGLVMGLWVHCFRRVRRKFLGVRDELGFERAFFAGVLSSIICLAFLAVTEHHLTTPTTIIVLAALTTTALNLEPPANRDRGQVSGALEPGSGIVG